MTSLGHARRKPVRPVGAGRRAGWVVAGVLRFVGRVLRGLIAAGVLLALVVGLPWALWHYVGWPLPDHVPTWDEVQVVLLSPMTDQQLLDVLACLCWITWAVFTVDVVRCAVHAVHDGVVGARWPDLSGTGPIQAVAALLVTAIVLSILGNRSQPSSSAPSPALATTPGAVATAPAWHSMPNSVPLAVHDVALATPTGETTTATGRTTSVVVRAPENGVHDSLWRIAVRTLGDSTRWPELFELNKGNPQPGGGTFTNPNLIFPGEELALPADAIATPPPDPPQQPPSPPPAAPPSTTAPGPASTAPSQPAPPAPSAQPDSATTNPTAPPREPGFAWGSELFLSLGLAAAVSAALIMARRRYRRRYQPGSGRRDDLPVAPVVYQLRLAHLRAQHDDDIDIDLDDGDHGDQPSTPPPVIVGSAEPADGDADDCSSFAVTLGVRDGREIALDLAVARGLGLVGAGAPAAARALALTALTTAHAPAPTDQRRAVSPALQPLVLIPADDLTGLLGQGSSQARLPDGIRVTASLEAALDELEAEVLFRARTHAQDGDQPVWPPVVLVTSVPEHQRQRLQAVLDHGSAFAVIGVLLGQWQPGVTAYVRHDGTVSATSPGQGEALRGTRMFRVGELDAADLLDLLHRAQPEPASEPPLPSSRAEAPGLAATDTGPSEAGHRDSTPADVASDAVRAADAELEMTAVVADEPVATELEIVKPYRSPTLPPHPNRPAGPGRHPAENQDAASTAEPDLAATAAPIRITVLGPPRVYRRGGPGDQQREVTGAFQPRTRELLVFLAVHPGGATREALVAALWPDIPPDKTTNALNTALSRLRRALANATGNTLHDLAVVADGRYQLDPALVEVDYWRFADAVSARRAARTEQDRIDAYRAVVNSYGGPLADGMSTEWIESAREAIRRDAIDTVAALARALVDHDPQQTLDLLELARAFDPHNELLYRDIMRLQERLGQLDAIPRTLTLLTTRLAELDDRPTEQAIQLAARLRQRHDDTPNPVVQPRHEPPTRHGRSAAS